MLFRRTRTAKLFTEKGKDRDPWESPFVPLFEEDLGKKSGLVLTESAARSLEKLRDPISSRSQSERGTPRKSDAFWGDRPGEVSFARLDAVCAAQEEKGDRSERRTLSREPDFKSEWGLPETARRTRPPFRSPFPDPRRFERTELSQQTDPVRQSGFPSSQSDVPSSSEMWIRKQEREEKVEPKQRPFPGSWAEEPAEDPGFSFEKKELQGTLFEALRSRLPAERPTEEEVRAAAPDPSDLRGLRDRENFPEQRHTNKEAKVKGDAPQLSSSSVAMGVRRSEEAARFQRSSPYDLAGPGRNEETARPQRPLGTPVSHPFMRDGERPLNPTRADRLVGKAEGVEGTALHSSSEPPVEENEASASLGAPIPPAPSIRRRTFFSSDAFLTIVLAAGVLLLCILLLWAVSRRETRRSDVNERANVIRIPSPKAFKVRPEEPTKPLIPYQDELIYGELDPRDKHDTKERILLPPSFAPELVIEKETSEDEYLDDDMDPVVEKETMVPPAPRTERRKDAAPQSDLDDVLDRSPPDGSLFQTTKKETRTGTRPHSSKLVTKQRDPKMEKPGTPKARSASSSLGPGVQSAAFYIQLGILPSVDVARKESVRLVTKYRALARYNLIVRPVRTDEGRTIFRLLVGPFATKSQAEIVSKSLGMKFKILS